jgi:PAB-dependent poly(A)-specific ribonuclease subunit 3
MRNRNTRGRSSGTLDTSQSELASAVDAAEFVPAGSGAPEHAPTEPDLAALTLSGERLIAARPTAQGFSSIQQNERGTAAGVRKPRRGRLTRAAADTPLLTAFLEEDFRVRWRLAGDLVVRCVRDPPALLPFNVSEYHSLLPLEPTTNPSATAVVYKAVSAENGRAYALRRYLGPMLARSDGVVRAFRSYSAVSHPNIVALRAAFTTEAFAALDLYRQRAASGSEAGMPANGRGADGHATDRELIFVYDMYPTAKTVLEYYFQGETPSLSEELFWVLALQLVSAVQALHQQYHLSAYGAIGAHHVLVVAPNRLKLNKLGIPAAFDPDDEDLVLSRVPEYQEQDWIALSELLLALAARSNAHAVREGRVRSLGAAIETIRALYSADVEKFLQMLANPAQISSDAWNQILVTRVWSPYEHALNHGDALETIAQEQLTDGDLFVVASKLAAVTERADVVGDPQWSEVGDRYLLKLFRDRVFHGTDLDLERIRDELRRLNARTEEHMLLHSRDGRSRLIVTYAELARFLETALQDLAGRLAAQRGCM